MKPPHNLDAERALLGAMLISPSITSTVGEIVTATDFYDPVHRQAFAAIVALGADADAVTVADVLQVEGFADATPKLVELQASAAASSTAARHARIVSNHARHRAVLGVAEDLRRAAAEGDDEAVAAASARLDALRTTTDGDPCTASWAPLDLTDALAGVGADPPSLGIVKGASGLLYAGRLHWLYGEPASGKGFVLLGVAAQLLEAGESVLYIDGEDSAVGVVGRLLDLGVTEQVIRSGFRYVRPDAPSAAGIAALVDLAASCRLVILDGVTELATLLGYEVDSNADVARFLGDLPRPLATAGPAVALIDHVAKSRDERGRWALGAGHKLAAVDGIAYSIGVVQPFARGRDGAVKLVVTKDRAGHYNRGDRIDVTVTADPDGGVHLDYARHDSTGFEPTALMAKVWHHLERYPGATQRDLRELGNTDAVRRAIDLLVDRDHLRIEHEGRSHRHYVTENRYPPGPMA